LSGKDARNNWNDDDDEIEPLLSVEDLLVSTQLEEASEFGKFMGKSESSITELVAMGAFEDPAPKKLIEEVVLSFSLQ
jgi:hypothetical protein